MDIVNTVAALIYEDAGYVGDFFAAVACVEYRGRWLLGLSTARDDRRGTWCMVGGGMEPPESPEDAAARECREESGVRVMPVSAHFTLPSKPGVAFVHCRAVGRPRIKHNNEFSAMGFFTPREMRSLDLYPNVKELIRLCY